MQEVLIPLEDISFPPWAWIVGGAALLAGMLSLWLSFRRNEQISEELREMGIFNGPGEILVHADPILLNKLYQRHKLRANIVRVVVAPTLALLTWYLLLKWPLKMIVEATPDNGKLFSIGIGVPLTGAFVLWGFLESSPASAFWRWLDKYAGRYSPRNE
ncbi:MAG: hypothetical protein ABH880_02820 [Patescibacteria group bacterium]